MLRMYTAYKPDAERWRRLGFTVRALAGGWEATGPIEAVKLRRLKDGSVVKRKAPAKGFGQHHGMRSDDRAA